MCRYHKIKPQIIPRIIQQSFGALFSRFIVFSRSLETGTPCLHLLFVNPAKWNSESGTIGAQNYRSDEERERHRDGKTKRTTSSNRDLVKRDHDYAAHVANSPATKTSGWRSLRLPVHLSLPYQTSSPSSRTAQRMANAMSDEDIGPVPAPASTAPKKESR